MNFVIFYPEDMLKSCLNFNESQPTYTLKRYYAYKKSLWYDSSFFSKLNLFHSMIDDISTTYNLYMLQKPRTCNFGMPL